MKEIYGKGVVVKDFAKAIEAMKQLNRITRKMLALKHRKLT